LTKKTAGMRDRIVELAERHYERVVEIRHRLHRMAEPGLREEETARILVGELACSDLEVRTGVGGHGIVADLVGGDGPVVALRADMDALPVKETTGAAYRSRNGRYCHCCGHDGNMACVVGAARILSDLRTDLPGRVRFIFQPAEELGTGAIDMIKAGALDPLPAAIFTLHGWPGLPAGTVASNPGIIMASSDIFTVRVIGKGGHAGRPHLARNPLVGMARVIDVLSRLNTEERVVTVCRAKAGKRPNIIDSVGVLTGTFRSIDPCVRETTLAEIESLVGEECGNLALRAEVKFECGSPLVVNAEGLYQTFCEVGCELLGSEKVAETGGPSMSSEDFGYYLERVPGLLFRLGMGEDSPELHNSDFDFNDESLGAGMIMLAGLAIMSSCPSG